ncbi:MAG TPA: hypothetical protein PLG75_02275 [Methanoculleus sp.]|nr:hypothetical protein [Methanoculleus sp.]
MRVWIRQIQERDRIVSEYLDLAIERLKAEDLLDEKKWEDAPGSGPPALEKSAAPGQATRERGRQAPSGVPEG